MYVSKENIIIKPPLSSYSSILFVAEAVFIPEQITVFMFGALLEISDTYRTS